MTVPSSHRSPKSDPDLPWSWSAQDSNTLLDHGGWRAMALAHAWYDGSEQDPPRRKSDYKLPHHKRIDGRLRVVLAGVRSAMNILAATRFQPQDYQVKLPAQEVRAVYEHLAIHLQQFDQEPPDILKGWSPSDGWPPAG